MIVVGVQRCLTMNCVFRLLVDVINVCCNFSLVVAVPRRGGGLRLVADSVLVGTQYCET